MRHFLVSSVALCIHVLYDEYVCMSCAIVLYRKYCIFCYSRQILINVSQIFSETSPSIFLLKKDPRTKSTRFSTKEDPKIYFLALSFFRWTNGSFLPTVIAHQRVSSIFFSFFFIFSRYHLVAFFKLPSWFLASPCSIILSYIRTHTPTVDWIH